MAAVCPAPVPDVAVCAGACGNGRADSCVVAVGEAGPQNASEPCDGTDFRGATCLTRGYLAGQLTCSTACTIEAAGCVGVRDAFSTAVLTDDATIAASAVHGTSLAVAWTASHGPAHFGLVVDRRLVESSVCFGSETPIRLDLVATTEGFALLSSASGAQATDVFRLDASGKLLGSRRFVGLALAGLKTRSQDGGVGDGTLLVGQEGNATAVHWLRTDLTDAFEPRVLEGPEVPPANAISFGDTILLVAQTPDSKLLFTRLLPDGTHTTHLETGKVFTNGWAGRRGDVALLTRFYSSDETTLEGFDASSASTGVVRAVPGLVTPPRVVQLDGQDVVVARRSGSADAVDAHGLAATVADPIPLLQGEDVGVIGSSATGELVIRSAGGLRLLWAKAR